LPPGGRRRYGTAVVARHVVVAVLLVVSRLWSFRYNCDGAQAGQTIPAAVCGPTGTCEPG